MREGAVLREIMASALLSGRSTSATLCSVLDITFKGYTEATIFTVFRNAHCTCMENFAWNCKEFVESKLRIFKLENMGKCT